MARAIVPAAFVSYIGRGDVEGKLPFMYLDRLGLVTTGIGNLIDNGSSAPAMGLGWVNPDGSPSSPGDIDRVWNLVKSHQEMSQGGGVAYGSIPGNDIRLSEQAIQNLVASKMTQFENTLRNRFPSYDGWPADAQMGLMRMAWAMGPAFSDKFPKFTGFANSGFVPDFAGMARESHVGGLNDARNSDIRRMFENADRVVRDGLDPETLLFTDFPQASAFFLNPVAATGGLVANRVAQSSGSGGLLLTLAIVGGGSYFAYRYAKKHGYLETLERKYKAL